MSLEDKFLCRIVAFINICTSNTRIDKHYYYLYIFFGRSVLLFSTDIEKTIVVLLFLWREWKIYKMLLVIFINLRNLSISCVKLVWTDSLSSHRFDETWERISKTSGWKKILKKIKHIKDAIKTIST